MRLSEAIRFGAMMKPQAFEKYFDGAGSCAFGAALDACGATTHNSLDAFARLDALATKFNWPLLEALNSACPVCGHLIGENTLPHLNDEHRWPREAIADWVETLEVQQAAGAVDPVERIAELTPVHARI